MRLSTVFWSAGPAKPPPFLPLLHSVRPEPMIRSSKMIPPINSLRPGVWRIVVEKAGSEVQRRHIWDRRGSTLDRRPSMAASSQKSLSCFPPQERVESRIEAQVLETRHKAGMEQQYKRRLLLSVSRRPSLSKSSGDSCSKEPSASFSPVVALYKTGLEFLKCLL